MPLLIGLLLGAGMFWLFSQRQRETEPPPRGLPAPRTPRTPRIPRLPIPPNLPPQSFGVPPSSIEIPGGTFIESIGWCPPGTAYNLATGLCEPQFVFPIGQSGQPIFAQTTGVETGACCASCEQGGPCEGCG